MIPVMPVAEGVGVKINNFLLKIFIFGNTHWVA
jgi:hypothetical protein